MFYQIIWYIGFFYFICKFYQFTKTFIFKNSLNLSNTLGNNTWAVVTGATDGIGKAFCIQLAKKKFNLILIARNSEKASNLSAILQQQGIQTKFIEYDFKDACKIESFNRIEKQLENLQISILINNVGISQTSPFHKQSKQKTFQIFNVNCISQLMLTKILIGKMLKRQKHSAIINLSSILGEINIPYLTSYAGSKTYNKILSNSLEIEFGQKIYFYLLKPNYVSTQMTKEIKDSFLNNLAKISSYECANAALNQLGQIRQSYGHWRHKIVNQFTMSIPTIILEWIFFQLKKRYKFKKQ